MLPRGDSVPTHSTSSSSLLRTGLISLTVAMFCGCGDALPTEPQTGDPAVLFGAFPGTNGLIVFASNRSPGGGILTMQLGGFDVQTLRSTGAFPAWSPDGTKIAFMDHDGTDYEIFVMNADGTGVVQLTFNTALDQSPSWSADGTKLVYYSDLLGGFQILMIDATTGGTPVELTGIGANSSPAWSPDGTKIAFTSDRDGNLEIYVMDANGSNQTRLTTDGLRDFDPSWSPDGSKIAFSHGGDFDSDIYVINANGTNPTNLTQTPTFSEVTAAWSPDGTRIAFVSDRDGNNEIYGMWAADGSSQQNWTINSGSDSQPDWQPVPTTPPGVVEDLQALITLVSELDAQKSVKNSLTASLKDALAALGASDHAGACIALGDFIRKVSSQSGKKIVASAAAALIAEANAILDALDCDGCFPNLAAPQLVLQSTTVLGNGFVEFQLDVPNHAGFPDVLFAPAPDLPACGLNTSASRSWVDVLDGNGRFLFGFCSLSEAAQLNTLWFRTPVEQWPAEAYITIHDRRCNVTYTSNRINLAGIL